MRSGGKPCKAQAVAQQRRPRLLLLVRDSGARGELIRIVDEVAAGAVWAEADGVEGAAQLCLVLGVPADATKLIHSVGKLALCAILAGPALLVSATELGLVASGDVG